MAVKAYLLIETDAGEEKGVLKELLKLNNVKSAESVTGPYDVIARVEAGTIDKLGAVVLGKIQSIRGIRRTTTCLGVKV